MSGLGGAYEDALMKSPAGQQLLKKRKTSDWGSVSRSQPVDTAPLFSWCASRVPVMICVGYTMRPSLFSVHR